MICVQSPQTTFVTVKDVAELIQYGYTASARQGDDGPRFLRITDIQDENVKWESVPTCEISPSDIYKYKLQNGDLVFARTGATTGKSFLIGPCPEAVFASYLIRIRPSSCVNPRYLAAFFKSPSYWNQINAGMRGIGQPNVNAKTLSEIALPLPSLDEQQTIVANLEKQLSRIDASVKSLSLAKEKIDRYRASVLKAACQGRLVPLEAELARKEGSYFESGQALLARIESMSSMPPRAVTSKPVQTGSFTPEGWTWTNVGTLCDVKGGVTVDQKRKFDQPHRRVPYIRVANVQRGRLELDDVRTITAAEGDIARLRLEVGDILLNEGGDRDKLGRGWVWEGQLPECIHQNHVFRARPRSKEFSSKFISWYANSFGQSFFFREGIQTTNLASVSMAKVKSLPVPCPPAAEQQRIVTEVERLFSFADRLESEIRAGLQRAARLRHSILQAAFLGDC